MMFPVERTGWTMNDIDEMDVHLFTELMELEDVEEQPQEKEVYLAELW